jgi:hypothetical protein
VIFKEEPQRSMPKRCFCCRSESSLDRTRPGVKLAPFI